MNNTIQFYPKAQWVTLNGDFTETDLLEIIDRIKDPSIRKEKLTSTKELEARAGTVVGMVKGK